MACCGKGSRINNNQNKRINHKELNEEDYELVTFMLEEGGEVYQAIREKK